MDTSTPRGISKAHLDGIARELARELDEQEQRFAAHILTLDDRIVALERALGALIAPATIAQAAQPAQPADGTPARH